MELPTLQKQPAASDTRAQPEPEPASATGEPSGNQTQQPLYHHGPRRVRTRDRRRLPDP